MTHAPSEPADILVVDDTPANLTVLTAILGKRGYRVRAAPNGQGALKTARKAPPDLILLDVQMSDLNGYAVCRALKDDPITRQVPIIFISALEDALDKVEAFEAGGVDYITKPFQIEEVLARVELQLALRRQQVTLLGLDQSLAQMMQTLTALQATATAAQIPLLATLERDMQRIQAAITATLPARAAD
jgi:PleD family two-component response regulator